MQGGTTMFRDFGRRIQRDLKRAVDARTSGSVEVNVMSHPMQRYAVWFGGSVLGMSPGACVRAGGVGEWRCAQ